MDTRLGLPVPVGKALTGLWSVLLCISEHQASHCSVPMRALKSLKRRCESMERKRYDKITVLKGFGGEHNADLRKFISMVQNLI